MILHADLLALRHHGFWRGVLITGPSGAGKSDLALRLMEEGFCLVADDRVVAWTSEGGLYGRAPDVLAGRIEARGVGVIAAPNLAFSRIEAVVDVDPAAEIERVPEGAATQIQGVILPRLVLPALEPSAPAKLRRWLIALG